MDRGQANFHILLWSLLGRILLDQYRLFFIQGHGYSYNPLFRISKNIFLDQIRKRKRQQENAFELISSAATSIQPGTEEALLLADGLAALSPEDRALLILIDQQGYSYREASEIFGLSESAVTSRIYRIRQNFRENVNQERKEWPSPDVLRSKKDG